MCCFSHCTCFMYLCLLRVSYLSVSFLCFTSRYAVISITVDVCLSSCGASACLRCLCGPLSWLVCSFYSMCLRFTVLFGHLLSISLWLFLISWGCFVICACSTQACRCWLGLFHTSPSPQGLDPCWGLLLTTLQHEPEQASRSDSRAIFHFFPGRNSKLVNKMH